MKVKSWIAVLFLLICGSAACNAQEVGDMLARVRPAVVTIVTKDKQAGQSSQGSGFIVWRNGVIVTAYHVIAEATQVKVKLTDGRIETAKVLEKDKSKDYALLKIAATELPALRICPPDQLRQGDRVYTLGTPLGLEQTATEGIVSAIRSDPERGMLIQTTAPISHGNSGGPLLNAQGEVVGVTLFTLKDGQSLDFALGMNELHLTDLVNEFLSPEESYESGKHEMELADAAMNAWNEQLMKSSAAENTGDKPRSEEERAVGIAAHSEYNKHRKQAYVLFKQAERFVPDWADLLYQLGRSSDNVQAAKHYYKLCLKIDPEHSDAWFRLGQDLMSEANYNHQWSPAADCLSKAAARESKLTDKTSYNLYSLYMSLGDCLDAAHRFEEAIPAHERAALLAVTVDSVRTNIPRQYILAGLDCDTLSKHDKALTEYRRSVEASKDRVRGYFELGRVLKDLGDALPFVMWYPWVKETEFTGVSTAGRERQLLAAIDAYSDSEKLNPNYVDDDGESAEGRIGEVYLKLKRWNEAIVSLQKAIRRDNSNAIAYEDLTEAYCHSGFAPLKNEDANHVREVLLAALKIKPEYILTRVKSLGARSSISLAFTLMGGTLRWLDMHREAAQAYRSALIMTPFEHSKIERMTDIASECLQIGDYDAVMEQCEALKRLCPNNYKIHIQNIYNKLKNILPLKADKQTQMFADELGVLLHN